MGNPDRKQSSRRAWAEQMKGAILETADDLFARLGYEGTTMAAVAGGAGCSVGFLYKLFPGKRALLSHLILRMDHQMKALRERLHVQSGLDGIDLLEKELEVIVPFLACHTALIRIYFQEESRLARETVQSTRRWHRSNIEHLELSIARGEVIDLDPRLLAAFIEGSIFGMLKQILTRGDDTDISLIPGIARSLIFSPLRITQPDPSAKETNRS